MKSLNKALLAAAMFAATGAANAAINNTSAATVEAYLSVYDKSQTLTFTLDLGVLMSDLIANVANDSYTLSYNLADNDMWNTFASGMDASQTKFAVAVGFGSKQLITGMTEIAKYNSLQQSTVPGTAIKNHANQINGGQVADNPGATGNDYAANLSSLVYDADTPNTGQHNDFNSIFGTVSLAQANIAYGTSGDFWYYNGIQPHTLAAGKWTLAGNLLSFGPAPANVPLPAAVWMFGAGLMGLLRATRRKYAAA
ncbi:hypothetical protein HC024_22465 [Methylococcaceae bacterium WWC4]|nr:hypothetical protein [Methylococcaceae bacterium WWC4]